MEKDSTSKLNTGLLIISVIIIIIIMIWAKSNVFDVAPEQKQQTEQEVSIEAEVVNTIYTEENNYYILVVEAGEEDTPKNRIKVKIKEPIYKIGDSVSVKRYDSKYYLDDGNNAIEYFR